MTDEITESAMAVQETAKTVRTGIEATQELGRFVSRITTEPDLVGANGAPRLFKS